VPQLDSSSLICAKCSAAERAKAEAAHRSMDWLASPGRWQCLTNASSIATLLSRKTNLA
jgi:hypothetical protein